VLRLLFIATAHLAHKPSENLEISVSYLDKGHDSTNLVNEYGDVPASFAMLFANYSLKLSLDVRAWQAKNPMMSLGLLGPLDAVPNVPLHVASRGSSCIEKLLVKCTHILVSNLL